MKIGLKMTDAYDMSKLLKITKAIQEDFECTNCKQIYKKKWCNGEKPCYFCQKYVPMRDTYFSILRDIDWCFMRSGEYDRKVFYNEFLDNLSKWSTKYCVLPTKEDLKTIEELRKIKNWTREWWH